MGILEVPRFVSCDRRFAGEVDEGDPTLVFNVMANCPEFIPYGPPKLVECHVYQSQYTSSYHGYVSLNSDSNPINFLCRYANSGKFDYHIAVIPFNQSTGNISLWRQDAGHPGNATSIWVTGGWYGDDIQINPDVDLTNYFSTGSLSTWKDCQLPAGTENCIVILDSYIKLNPGGTGLRSVRPKGSTWNRQSAMWGTLWVTKADATGKIQIYQSVSSANDHLNLVAWFPARSHDDLWLNPTLYAGGYGSGWSQINPTNPTYTDQLNFLWNIYMDAAGQKWGWNVAGGANRMWRYNLADQDYWDDDGNPLNMFPMSYGTSSPSDPRLDYRLDPSYAQKFEHWGWLQSITMDASTLDTTLWTGAAQSESGMIDTRTNHFRANNFVFTASDKSIYCPTANNWNTLFRVGDTFRVHNSVSNNGSFTVMSVTNNKIIVAETIVNES